MWFDAMVVFAGFNGFELKKQEEHRFIYEVSTSVATTFVFSVLYNLHVTHLKEVRSSLLIRVMDQTSINISCFSLKQFLLHS